MPEWLSTHRHTEYIMQNARLYESQVGITTARRSSNNLRHADGTILVAESEEELKTLLIGRESEKAGLKLNTKKTKMGMQSYHFMANRRGKSDRFSFLGLQITADSNCSQEIKRCLLLIRKPLTNSDSVLKSRDISLLTKVHIVKSMVFPVVMYGWELDNKEGWVPKNWCFQIVVLEQTLESPLDCQSTLMEINPGYSLEGLMLKL